MKTWTNASLALFTATALAGLSVRAQTPPAETGSAASSTEEEILELNPFEVSSTKDKRYQATGTMGATKTGTAIKDLPITINVVTEEFLNDIGARSMSEALQYQAGVNIQDNDSSSPAARIRGMPANFIMRDGYVAYSQPNWTAIDRMEVIRGAAAIVYGQTQPGGVINWVTKKASFDKDFGRLGLYGNEFGSLEGSFDTNQVNDGKTVAIRAFGSAGRQRYSYEGMKASSYSAGVSLRWRPLPKTDVMLQYLRNHSASKNAFYGNLLPYVDPAKVTFGTASWLPGNPRTSYSYLTTNPLEKRLNNLGVGVSNEFRDAYTAAYLAQGLPSAQLPARLAALGVNTGSFLSSPEMMDPYQAKDPYTMNPFENNGIKSKNDRYDVQGNVTQELIKDKGTVKSAHARFAFSRTDSKGITGNNQVDIGNSKGLGPQGSAAGDGQWYGPAFMLDPANPFYSTYSYVFPVSYWDARNLNDTYNLDFNFKFDFGQAAKLNVLAGIEHGIQKYFSHARLPQKDSTGRWAFSGVSGPPYDAPGSWNAYAAGAWGPIFGSTNPYLGPSPAGGYRVGAGFAGWGYFNTQTGVNIPAQRLFIHAPVEYSINHLVQRTDFMAYYVTAQLKLLNERLELLAALRYGDINRDDFRQYNYTNGKPIQYEPLSPQVGAIWHFGRRTNVYASYSESFQYELNGGADSLGNVQPLTKGQGYEVGAKSTFFDGALALDINAYQLSLSGLSFTDYSLQRVIRPGDPEYDYFYTNNLGTSIDSTNPNSARYILGGSRWGGEMESRGGEIQAFIYPTKGLQHVVQMSYTRVKIVKGMPQLVGSEVLDNPKFAATLWNTYDFQSSPLKGFKLGLGGRYNQAYDTSWSFRAPATFVTDGMIQYGWAPSRGVWASAQINVKNITDEVVYSVDGFPTSNNYASQAPTLNGQGRVVQFSLNLSY